MPAEYCLLLKLSECQVANFFTCTERRDTVHPADKLASGVMSALPPKADMCSARGNVCYGPEADMCSARLVSAKGQRRKSFQGLLGRQIGHWRSRYRVFDHRGGRRGVRHDPDIIGRQAKSYWAAALCFSPAIASLIAVCTSQWRNRTTASMRSRNSTRLLGGSLASVITACIPDHPYNVSTKQTNDRG